MTLAQRFQRTMFNRVARPMMQSNFELEASVAEIDHALCADGLSAERFEILLEAPPDMKPPGFPRTIPFIVGSVRGIRKSLCSLKKDPPMPRTESDPGLVEWIEGRAKELGASSVGYTRVPRHLVFREKAVAWPNAIVLTMEMDADDIAKAPHIDTSVMVHRTYRNLGRVANKLAGELRARGYGAHAGHPLGGLTLYPPLARAAGLGWQGIHGLIITPDFGPRVRLAAVFTSLDDLPFAENATAHAWIEDFCQACLACKRACPGDAILTDPIRTKGWQLTYTINEKCFPVFLGNHGCSLCITVCPFSKRSYESIRDRWFHRREVLEERTVAV